MSKAAKRTLPNLPRLFRTCEIELKRVNDKRGSADSPVYEISFSSETPVPRWFGTETLSHDKAAVDMRYLKKGGAVLVDHRGDQVAVMDEAWVDEQSRKTRAKVRFSRSARGQEVRQDVDDGIRTRTSIGYQIIKAKLVKQGATIAEDEWLVTRWMPYEGSLVGIPADLSVGVGRDERAGEQFPVEIEGGESAEEERSMCTKCQKDPCGCEAARTTTTPPSGGERSAGSGPVAVLEAPARQQLAEISRLAERHGVSNQVAGWIERGLSVDQVSREILNAQVTKTIETPPSERSVVDLPEKDIRRYSYCRAILMAEPGAKLDGLEGEVHAEIARKMPTGYKPHGGIFAPLRLRSERALDSKTAGAAAELVFDQPGELIELLRNRAVVAAMGARILSGLTAPMPFPKQTAAATAYWTGENTGVDVTESNLTTGIIALHPKTLQATTSYARQLLALASLDGEALVKDDLAIVHSLAIDRAGIHGKSASGEPTGIYQAPDVISKAMGGQPDFAKIVDMVAQCGDKNALQGSLGFITTALLAGVLSAKPKIASAAAGFIWEGPLSEGILAGYKAMSTAQISKTMTGSADTGGSEHGMIFGNWADMLIGMWGAMEFIVDPYAKKKQGLIEVTSFQMTDVLIRHGESFVKTTGATL